MACGYGDKLFASSSASPLMPFQLGLSHLQSFSLYLQVQRDYRQRTDPFYVTEDQWINQREITGLKYPFTKQREGRRRSVLLISSNNIYWLTLPFYWQSNEGQIPHYLQTAESSAISSCFFSSNVSVLIHFCVKNWRPAQRSGGPETKGILYIWSLSFPALWWSLRIHAHGGVVHLKMPGWTCCLMQLFMLVQSKRNWEEKYFYVMWILLHRQEKVRDGMLK